MSAEEATAGISAMDVNEGAAAGIGGGEQVVTPWDVAGGEDGKIDYAKLVRDFGCSEIDASLVARIEKVTGCKAHPFLRRGMFFAHRELDQVSGASCVSSRNASCVSSQNASRVSMNSRSIACGRAAGVRGGMDVIHFTSTVVTILRLLPVPIWLDRRS